MDAVFCAVFHKNEQNASKMTENTRFYPIPPQRMPRITTMAEMGT